MKERNLFTQILLSLNFLSLSDIESLPEPYNQVDLMEYNPMGWHRKGNAEHLEQFIQHKNVKTIIEVGCWMGLSTMHMASLIPEEGKVYAVDHWLASANATHPPEIASTLYDQFLSNMIHSNLYHKVIPIRMSSLEAAQSLSIHPDLIYLDATHTYEAVWEDLHAWFPFVKGHGILCGDDWAWGDGGVAKAVTEFAEKNALKACTNGWFWWLEE